MIIAPATAGQTATTTNPATNPAQTNSSPVGSTSDFETFLTLLTTQLQNQDPLKPMESTAFVAQLASFSAVEQQVRTNDTLTQIQGLLGQSSSSGLSGWIGQDVRAVRATEFRGAPVDVFVAPVPGSERAELVVKDSLGAVVQRVAIGPSSNVMEWAGVDGTGSPMPNGTYSFFVASYKGETQIDSTQAGVYSAVQESRFQDGETQLVLADGSVISADSVTAVRAAPIP